MPSSPSSSLHESLVTSFIDAAHDSVPHYRTSLVVNDKARGMRVLTEIETALEWCDRFAISVAFITKGGIAPLLMLLKKLAERGVQGRILTTDYLYFTEPQAIRQLMKLPNLEVKIYRTGGASGEGFHTKGYIFRSNGLCRILIGSSNLTATALATNREWNTRFVSEETGEIAKAVEAEFRMLWERDEAEDAAEVIDAYEAEYHSISVAQRDARKYADVLAKPVTPKLVPNAMQVEFVERLEVLRAAGEKRALLISATGTGKTYAAAFATARIEPVRMLFLVHREQIARQACESFRRVLGDDSGRFAVLSGTQKNIDNARWLFATMQTFSRDDVLNSFPPGTFDLVIIDEVHRAGAPSYRKIMSYLKPKFWLGMTGSPDRMDGYDIYGLFHHNIACEIRLQQALENDFLTPFHYFGIASLELEKQTIDTKRFIELSEESQFGHMLEEALYYGASGDRVHGLVFVSSKAEAANLAKYLTRNGHPAEAVTGDDSQERREELVSRLATGCGANLIEYLVTVDVFNEGVDIPEVNQIILMRPTESAIIFIQQLGRGLRKFSGKEYVVVLDFIGAYEKNYLIATALSGDRSCVKERLRRFISTERRALPGISSVHFDPVAEKQIYRAIDTAKLDTVALLKDAYRMLKFKLGRIPRLADFEEHGSIDPVKFFGRVNNVDSYHHFLKKYDKDYKVTMSDAAEKLLGWISRKLGTGIRPSEAMVIQAILQNRLNVKDELVMRLRTEAGFEPDDFHLANVFRMLTNNFEKTEDDRVRNQGCEILAPHGETDEDGKGGWQPAAAFATHLRAEPAFREAVQELADFILARWHRDYAPASGNTFLRIGETYTYEYVCRLLDWKQQQSGQNIGGYFFDKTTRTFPVFVNYEKDEKAIQYHDHFLSDTEIVTISKTGRRPGSVDEQRMLKLGEYAGIRTLLFVRRNREDAESKAFYYLGEMEPAVTKVEPMKLANGKDVFEVTWRLKTPVPRDLYDYLTGE
ncbi:DUF3427 domain-containing protein [Sutterella sp.]|uniref:DUF3427 domain-containing protein n=1 Tax=Sutterella sp. TaxID=1981025 RepID=UPI0026DFDB79|nr:DEAD/DEAH box helicase [Sutterella sp.]MDO5531977.1 DEAD/DEAH box helicase [Sutterella sp.]